MDDKVLQLQAMYPDLSADAARRKLGETGGDPLAAVEYFLEHGTADEYASPVNTGAPRPTFLSMGALCRPLLREREMHIGNECLHMELGTLVVWQTCSSFFVVY
jgi:hypothetical protein